MLTLLGYSIVSQAQVQWYQDQDSHAPFPYGTYSNRSEPLTAHSFLASYQWKSEGDQVTWKLSKSNLAGQEQKTFMLTHSNAILDFHAGHRNEVFVFEKVFPSGQAAQYNVYRLDTNLVLLNQRTISFPGGYEIFNLNAFEIDDADNVYFAGDGQYPNGPGFSPASFVLKSDRHLNTKWSKIDSVPAVYCRVHIDRRGNVIVVDDNPDLFPAIHVREWTENGQLRKNYMITGEARRESLGSLLDDNDNFFLYGNYSKTDTSQAVFLYRVNRNNAQTYFRKSLFEASSAYMVDLRADNHGSLYSLVQQYNRNSEQFFKVSRINPGSGSVNWNKSFAYAHDSTLFSRVVVGNDEQFFLLGMRIRSGTYSTVFVQRLRKNGHTDGSYNAPDSASDGRQHWLTDGFIDRNEKLVAVGTTQDIDPITFNSTYMRAFAVRYAARNECHHGEAAPASPAMTDVVAKDAATALVVYPNPAQGVVNIANINTDEYDRLLMYNMSGAVVLQQTVSSSSKRIDVSGMADGVYLLVLRSAIGLPEKTTRVVIRK